MQGAGWNAVVMLGAFAAGVVVGRYGGFVRWFPGKEKNGVLVGVDIGGTAVKVGLVSTEGRVLVSLQRNIEDHSLEGVCALVGEMCEQAAASCKVSLENGVIGVGCCVPGMVDIEKGQVNFAAHFDKWPRPAPLAAKLSQVLHGHNVKLENDGKVALLAEIWLGAAKGARDVAMLSLGTGVGGALMSGGRLLRGHNDMAGEVGHVIYSLNGRYSAGTGVKGPLEEYVSARAVGLLAQEALRDPQARASSKLALIGSSLSAKHVFDLARQGDQLACRIVEETTEILAVQAINLVRTLDVSCVIFGGGLVAAGDILIDGIRKHFRNNYWNLSSPDQVQLSLAHLGTQAGMVGAAYIARQDLP